MTGIDLADLDILGEVGEATIDIGVTTRQRVPAPLSSVQMPVASAGFCVLLPRRHPFASRSELAMAMLHSERLVTLAGVPLPTPVSMCAATDSAPPTGRFVIMPGVDCLKQAVVNGLGIGIVPRAAVSSRTAHAGLVVIPLSPARAASALTVVYRDNHGQPTAVEDFIEAVRITGEDRTSRKAPIAMRIPR